MDYGEASIADEQADTVRIMSIHKSKGLEFPVVIVAGMGKLFNTQDIRGSIVIHPELGVGMDVIDLEKRTKAPTLLKKVIQKQVTVENLSEEMRVLYVAMTRAKEKLILIGACKEQQERSWKNIRKEKRQPFLSLSGAFGKFLSGLGAACCSQKRQSFWSYHLRQSGSGTDGSSTGRSR